MDKPNFLIVGAAKCGTTSLYGYLKQHPEVFIPDVKECRYFSHIENKNKNPFTCMEHAEIIKEKVDYYNLFKNANKKARGDVSPDYLYYYEESIKNILQELGKDTKIIIMLREPVNRAFSNYLHIVRDEEIKLSFEEIISKEKEWIENNIWYGFYTLSPSFYFEAVNSYLQNFKYVKVVYFDEFIKNSNKQLIDICKFLDIKEDFDFENPSFTNKTGVPKSKFLHKLLKGNFFFKKYLKYIILKFISKERVSKYLIKLKEKNLIKPEIKEYTKNELNKLFLKDIERLEKLLNKNLDHWKYL